ncbi:MAG: hypothetical protein U5K32_02945 [Bacteroidales bacterium]|nr:hypothetical protein [Bacteroidales bacterium]
MRRIINLIILMVLSLALSAQDEPAFGIKWSGFVKNDFFFDSRQTVAAREGHFLLWPSPVVEDENGEDINAVPNFNFLAVQSRLTAALSGPDAFGASTSGLIEADFFAQANDNINLLRLRHAFIKFDWTNIEVLTGQYWNPFFVTGCFPGTVSFNTGTPLQSFARNPQLRVVYKSSGLRIMAAALAQRDFSSRGADGVSSSYLRNSGTPDMHLQASYSSLNINNTGYHLGAGLAYKTVVPRLESTVGPPFTGNTYKVDEKVAGLSAIAFARINTVPLTVKLQARYGENIADVLAISGYAVKEVVNIASGEQSYTPLRSMSFWAEVHTNGTRVQAGLFGGYFRNMGTKDPMSDAGNTVYGLGTDIYSLYRLSPRLIINSGSARLAFELEYTAAAYGEGHDVNYVPDNTTMASNLRALIAVYYFF